MLIITLVFIVVGLLLLSTTSFEIREEIEIKASSDKVWETVISFENYNKWNTQLAFLGGKAKPNGKLHLKLSAEGASPYEFNSNISHWVVQKQFAWIAITGLPKIFDGEHFFELVDLGNEKTLLINREKYSGILSQLFRQLPMMKTAPNGFKKMNLELKNYIENQ